MSEPPPVPDYFNGTVTDLVLDTQKGVLQYCRAVHKYRCALRRPTEMRDLCVGYDPGQRNAGLAILSDGRLDVWQIVWADMSGPEEEMHYASHVIQTLVGSAYTLYVPAGRAVVENASYGSGFGQAGLANNRAAAVIGLIEAGYQVKLTPPATISKQVLGHRRRQAKKEWGHLFGQDGATAAAACLLAAGMTE